MSDLHERLSALSPEQRALFEARLKQKGLNLPRAQTITRRKESDACPLSIDQEQIWFVDQLDPGTPAYNINSATALGGSLDVAALQQALDLIARRHEILRTTFRAEDGRPRQIINPDLTIPITLTDLSAREDAHKEAMRLAVEEVSRSFDLARGPLMRVRLFRLGDREHVMVVTLHHIVADSWSFGIFNQEICALYSDLSAGRPTQLAELPVQFADFAIWQRQRLEGDALEAKLAYWKRRLSNAPPVLSLPTDRPRPESQTYRGATHFTVIPMSVAAPLKTLGQQQKATMFMTLLASFNLLLYRYSGQQDILIGSPIANRDNPETEGLIGYFINMLVLRTDLSGDISFRDLLDRVRQVALEAYVNQDVPFGKVVQELQTQRDVSQNPLFQVSFVYLDFQNQATEFGELEAVPLKVDAGTSMMDMTLILSEIPEGIDASFEFSTELFDVATVERMAGHFLALLKSVIKNPDERLWALPMMSEAERRQALVDWNQLGEHYSPASCLHHLFERQVLRSPDAVALVHEQRRVSYRELNERANAVARYLAKLGAAPEVLIGLYLDRSVEMIVGMLGILKSGAAYLPLDPEYPAERLAFLLEDSRAPVVLTREDLMRSLPECEARIVCLDTDRDLIAQESREGVSSGVTSDNLAYVIYTSGSTGNPKGVMISHRAICNRVLTDLTDHTMNESDRLLQTASSNFDASVWEIFTPLCSGAQLVVADSGGQRDTAYMVRTIADNGITVFNVVPSLLQVILDEPAFQSCNSLRLVYCGGEAMPAQLQERFLARSSATLLNAYGPTESAVDATCWTCKPDGAGWTVPIGRPLPNVEAYLLDPHMQPVPVGVPGELFIGGEQLARGYLRRADLTADRFLPNPFSGKPGSRLYRTGDQARHMVDGNIIFIGRIDEQVKVRGLRIELGEIENVLMRHASVRDAVVTVRADSAGNKRLAAYVVLNPGESLKGGELREFTKQKLPEYMVPSWFTQLELLPQMPNGKIDRNALPPPDQGMLELEKTYVAPRNQAEEVLSKIWSDLLNIKRVGIHDNFFHLGGDSILSIQIIARANETGLRLTPKQLFQHQTIAGLAAVAGSARAVEAEQGSVTGEVPLTPIQRWFFEQDFPEPHHWNQAILLEMKQHLDPAVMRRVTERLLEHHDALRLRFHRDESGWRQVNAAHGSEIPFAFVDLTTVPEADRADAILEKASELQASLNLSEGPLLRICLFSLGENTCRLLVIAHHLVMDGMSWRILLEDMRQAYRQLSEGQEAKLAPKTTSFKRWAELLKSYAQSSEVRREMSYWHGELSKDFARLPVDHVDAANVEASARTVSVSLTPEETHALLHEVPAAYRTQINDALLTALAQAFRLWTKQPRVLIELEGHGREDVLEGVELSRTVGWFTTAFPLALEVESKGDIEEDLRRVKEQLRAIPGRGLGLGLLRYMTEGYESAERLRGSIRPEASFNYLGQLDQALDEGSAFGLAKESIGPTHSERAMRTHLLEVEASIIDGQLQVVWGYSENLHRRQTVESLAHDYICSLRKLIAHCRSGEARGFTPSDFPEARLNQKDLDRLIAGLSGAGKE